MNNTTNINSTIKQCNKKLPHCSVEFTSPFAQEVLSSSLGLESTYHDSAFNDCLWSFQTNSLIAHNSKPLLLSFAQCHICTASVIWLPLRQYPQHMSISLPHLAHFEHQLLVCYVWDCHDVVYAHHPFYVPRTPQSTLLNQEYMSEFINTNTYMINTDCEIKNTVDSQIWQHWEKGRVFSIKTACSGPAHTTEFKLSKY